MYKLTGVTKDYQKGRATVHALQGVDLVIEDGEWLAIQGPTGHGKTTLLQMLGGLDRPTSGVIEFDGHDLAQMRESQVTKIRASSIGFIFQTFNLIPTLSAQENVETALVPLGISAGARRDRALQSPEGARLWARAKNPAGGAFRRPAAAGGHRQGTGQGAQGAARRRANRQPGRGHEGRDHRAAGGSLAGPRADPGPDHARQLGRPPGPARRADAERQAVDQAGHQGRNHLTAQPGMAPAATRALGQGWGPLRPAAGSVRSISGGVCSVPAAAIRALGQRRGVFRARRCDPCAGSAAGCALQVWGRASSHQTALPESVRRAPQRTDSWLTTCSPRPRSSSSLACRSLGRAAESSWTSHTSPSSRTRRSAIDPWAYRTALVTSSEASSSAVGISSARPQRFSRLRTSMRARRADVSSAVSFQVTC